MADEGVVLDANLLGRGAFATADVARIAVTASAVIRVFMRMLLGKISRRLGKHVRSWPPGALVRSVHAVVYEVLHRGGMRPHLFCAVKRPARAFCPVVDISVSVSGASRDRPRKRVPGRTCPASKGPAWDGSGQPPLGALRVYLRVRRTPLSAQRTVLWGNRVVRLSERAPGAAQLGASLFDHTSRRSALPQFKWPLRTIFWHATTRGLLCEVAYQ